ncbi:MULTISPECIES: XDD3 family exosortase-dependent surface protein [Cyanophyceae]|uniref:XDD3 family exosortase-dependent surface protein n=1 Tax=Cyanophyceae TaxID=3028117 RepID=UPI0016825B6F|nr:XDD3 family exosortase-dependent surface protein [Trichocoleus sp. FACHB-40]MBD2001635.1 PEP-CTERM sorting domain-containing protein [Trichocoleus sp. FACHB-40]
MKNYKIALRQCALIATTLGLISITGRSAHAGILYNNWSYAIDSFNDSTQGTPLQVGGTDYEIYGLAIKETKDSVFVAISTNLPVGGVSSHAQDGYTRWGDLIFNFTEENLSAANAQGNLLGIRFDEQNESGVSSSGIYSYVTLKDVAKENNNEFGSLSNHNQVVQQHGGTPSIGDLAANDLYFEQNQQIQNIIASGTKIGELNLLEGEFFGKLGLDFGHFGANSSYTIGFSFDRSLLPTGSFIAHLAPECDNDIVAIKGETISVPEPSGVLSLAAVGLILSSNQIRQRRQVHSADQT